MAEIREKIAQMANVSNPEKSKLGSQFHLLEDEQTSFNKLILKLNSNNKG